MDGRDQARKTGIGHCSDLPQSVQYPAICCRRARPAAGASGMSNRKHGVERPARQPLAVSGQPWRLLVVGARVGARGRPNEEQQLVPTTDCGFSGSLLSPRTAEYLWARTGRPSPD